MLYRAALSALLLAAVPLFWNTGRSAAIAQIAEPTNSIEEPSTLPNGTAQPLPAAPTAAPEPTNWLDFTDAEELFAISMPDEPIIYTLAVGDDPESKADEASQMYVQMQLVNPSHLEIYAVALVQTADLTTGDETPTALLEGCVSSLSRQAPVSPPQALTVGDYPGVEAAFQLSANSFQVARCYLASDRAYLLTVTRERFVPGETLSPAAPVEDTTGRSPSMDFFFNSFQILQ